MLRIGQSAGTAIMEALTDYQGASHRDEGIVEPLNFNNMSNNKVKIQRVCPVCGKLHNYSNSKGYCEKHAMQLNRYGKFLDNSPRSIYDPNEYRIEGDACYISVYNKRGEKMSEEVVIDVEDMPIILKYKVYIRLCTKGNIYYAFCNVARNKKVKVHRLLCPTEETVDHINGNSLDNRKVNLRPANMSLQNLNKKDTLGIQKRIDTRNGQNKVTGYAATMGYNHKRYLSKYYKTEAEAKFYRSLLLQLLPFETNYNLDFMSELTEEQKENIIKDFENRFKNRVL